MTCKEEGHKERLFSPVEKPLSLQSFATYSDEAMREILDLTEEDADPLKVFENVIDLSLASRIGSLKEKTNLIPHPAFTAARSRSNLFERVGKSFFINRSAVKLAGLDAVYGLTGRKLGAPSDAPFRFMDICGGPGGFTEYLLWRKHSAGEDAEGWGITLRGDLDFRLDDFLVKASQKGCFEAVYGKDGSGDITSSETIRSVVEHVSFRAVDGVDLAVADGGFDMPHGKEHLQEYLMRRLILCEILTMFCVLRQGGDFVVKLFDVRTPFMVELLYILYMSFERISIIKPCTSRPANSERYVVCVDLKKRMPTPIIDHLFRVNERLSELHANSNAAGALRDQRGMEREDAAEQKTERTIGHVVKSERVVSDKRFMEYVRTSNNLIGRRQVEALEEILRFAADTTLRCPINQEFVRRQCLKEWHLPAEEIRKAHARPDRHGDEGEEPWDSGRQEEPPRAAGDCQEKSGSDAAHPKHRTWCEADNADEQTETGVPAKKRHVA